MDFPWYQDHSHPWVKTLSFTDTSVAELLANSRDFLAQRSSSKPPTWVFDIDSTLVCLGSRIKSIYALFLREHPNPPSDWQRVLPFLNPKIQRYNIRETFETIFAIWDSEHAFEKSLQLFKSFEDFWAYRFFSSHHTHYDKPYPGSQAFVENLAAMGFHIIYLSGRDHPRMGQGTWATLRREGYPTGPHTEVILKSDHTQDDVVFKHRVAKELRQRTDVAAFIDNEPENLVMFAEEHPQAQIIFFHSVMSPRHPQKDFRAALGTRPALRLNHY